MLSDCMIDLETLATTTDAAILTIGAVKFDPLGDDSTTRQCETLYIRVDLDSCDALNLTISDSTIEWWAQQSPEAQEEAFTSNDRVSIQEAFNQLYKFCWGTKRVWSNGSGFDVVICETIFDKLKKARPWSYWQVRDCRTIYALGIDPMLPKVTAHNALEDAVAQAIGVQNVCRKLKDLGITPFEDFRFK
jgi:hypothetical protein